MKSEDLQKSIELEIKKYEKKLEIQNVGFVVQSGDGIARIYGLKRAMAGELIKFSKDSVYGMALNLEEDSLGVILFGDTKELKEGDEAYSTGKLFTVSVSEDILGRVVSPLGEALDGLGNIKKDKDMFIERDAPKMFDREKVRIPLQTGIKAIDGLIPIGMGQRELIIGDRHTGKSALAIDTIINQKDKDVISVYVSIGQKQASVARIVETLKEKGAFENTVIVSASASDEASLQFIAPYAGCAIAEYFMDLGKNVLIIYDDLSKHAVAYREISLLLRRPPGREAFPGDIFYIHAKLLERAAMLKENDKGLKGSITALPIVETLASDVSAYIPTNIISITDGQIYLESNLFNSGIRPAINAGLSVSRVGGDAQNRAMKQIAGHLKIALAQYREIASFSQLSSDLDASTKKQLERGKRIVEVLKQGRGDHLSTQEQIVIFYAVSNSYLDSIPVENIKDFESSVKNNLKKEKKLNERILSDEGIENLKNDLDKFLEKVMKSV